MSKYGPGAAHMHDLMRYAIERGCGAFDFTIGDERYKAEWCEGQITLYDPVSAATLRCGGVEGLCGGAAQALDQADAGALERGL